ncbi:MAG: 2-dehydro-3-deoxy-D-gluconate 5-dehydrogenase KduD [Bifidobacteriaceae bacterium]|jgi:2-deoxy-D-gluconate 3-dehydrogenase|nr:2-dehydro-3-deoxy-D-gluconate 5-dehydrogenase KduD [Bifidobacteriaceae bacterium]
MILDQFSLEGRVALVTGANQGLGQGIALGLAEAGADIAVSSPGEADSTISQIEALGRRTLHLPLDLTTASPQDLAALVDSVAPALGRLDILVNNAGIIHREPATDHAAEAWRRVMAINLDAAFFLAQAAGRAMVAQGSGKIIFIASMLSFQGGILVPSYTATKHAVAGLTKAFANEWAASGVNVNAIAPGYMATDNTTALRADPVRSESILSRIPAGRWGTPADLAAIAVFLSAPASDYLNGAVVPVDGGWLVR